MKIYKITEASDYLGVSINTLKTLANNGKLKSLRNKWKGHVPKSDSDPDWWNFKCDSVIATGIKRQIEEIKTEPQAHSEGVNAL